MLLALGVPHHRIRHKQGVAIGRCSHDRFGAYVGVAATIDFHCAGPGQWCLPSQKGSDPDRFRHQSGPPLPPSPTGAGIAFQHRLRRGLAPSKLSFMSKQKDGRLLRRPKSREETPKEGALVKQLLCHSQSEASGTRHSHFADPGPLGGRVLVVPHIRQTCRREWDQQFVQHNCKGVARSRTRRGDNLLMLQ
jgi:hypothetical protein